jgi:hypothetical protein
VVRLFGEIVRIIRSDSHHVGSAMDAARTPIRAVRRDIGGGYEMSSFTVHLLLSSCDEPSCDDGSRMPIQKPQRPAQNLARTVTP